MIAHSDRDEIGKNYYNKVKVKGNRSFRFPLSHMTHFSFSMHSFGLMEKEGMPGRVGISSGRKAAKLSCIPRNTGKRPLQAVYFAYYKHIA